MSELNKEQLSALIDGEHDSEHTIDNLIHDQEMKDIWSRYHLIGDCLRDNLPEGIFNQVYTEVTHILRNEPTVLASQTKKRFNIKPFAGFAIAASVAMIAVFSIQNNEVFLRNIALGGATDPDIALSNNNPDEYSKVLNLADNTNLPLVVKDNLAQVRNAYTLKQIDTSNHLVTNEFLSYLDNESGSSVIGGATIATTTVAQPEVFNFSEPQVLPAAVKLSDTPDSVANQRLNNYLMNHNKYRSSNGMNGILPYVRMVTIETQE